ncbi:MAG: twin-arginine translocase subunit TatC, partial [Clostridiales bacterium]|nr:twin-arginine translocase subunit TatC [Clostridiales bacterium]
MKAGKAGGLNTLIGHFEELRKRCLIAVAAFVAASGISLLFAERLFDFLLGFAPQYSFIYDTPSQIVVQYFNIGLVSGLVLASPVIVFELWVFLAPALKKREKAMIAGLLSAGVLLFLAGAYFACRAIIPFMLDFFLSANVSARISPTITVENYIHFLLTMLLIFGIVFEMPAMLAGFSLLRLVKAAWLVRSQKFAVVAILLLAAIITPPDVVSQIIVAIPLLALFEISVGVCWLIERSRGDAGRDRSPGREGEATREGEAAQQGDAERQGTAARQGEAERQGTAAQDGVAGQQRAPGNRG